MGVIVSESQTLNLFLLSLNMNLPRPLSSNLRCWGTSVLPHCSYNPLHISLQSYLPHICQFQFSSLPTNENSCRAGNGLFISVSPAKQSWEPEVKAYWIRKEGREYGGGKKGGIKNKEIWRRRIWQSASGKVFNNRVVGG